MKKIIIFILIILIIGVGIYLLKPKETPKETKKEIPKTNEKITADKTIDNVLISNISLVYKKDKTIFSSKITNLTANELKYTNLIVTVRDKNNKEVATLITYFGSFLKPEETKIITAETNKKIIDAASLEYVLN